MQSSRLSNPAVLGLNLAMNDPLLSDLSGCEVQIQLILFEELEKMFKSNTTDLGLAH